MIRSVIRLASLGKCSVTTLDPVLPAPKGKLKAGRKNKRDPQTISTPLLTTVEQPRNNKIVERLTARQVLAEKLTDADRCEPPPAEFAFAYISTEQEHNIQDLVELVLQYTLIDRNRWMVHGAMFRGMLGSGKSRMALELPALMRRVAEQSKDPKAPQLVKLLQRPKVITIDWQHEHAYDDSEKWPSEALGIRLAARYWFPNYSFKAIKKIVSQLPERERQFCWHEVMRAIWQENEAKPMEEKYSMLYIVNEEFEILHKATPHHGQPLRQALIHEFQHMGRDSNERFFVFGCFTGAGYCPAGDFHSASYGLYPGYCIHPLTLNSMLQIAQKELKGAKSPDLALLLTSFGGNPGILETFLKDVAPNYNVEDIKQLSAVTTAAVARKYPETGGLMKWPVLLSFAGYWANSHRTAIGLRDQIVDWCWSTWVQQIERLGLTSLYGPTSTEKWFSPMVLDTPLTIALTAMSESTPQEGDNEIIPEEISQLIQQWKAMTTKVMATAYKMEELAVDQLIFRWNVFNFATDPKIYVSAERLFYGGNFSKNFGAHQFACEKNVVVLSSDLIDQTRDLGVKDSFDGYLKLQLIEDEKKEPVIVWIDARHFTKQDKSALVTESDVQQLKTKLELVAAVLPNFKHLLVVVSNKNYDHDPKTFNDDMCIIARDGLTFGMSPWFSQVAQIGLRDQRAD